jgi:hypothetical protein
MVRSGRSSRRSDESHAWKMSQYVIQAKAFVFCVRCFFLLMEEQLEICQKGIITDSLILFRV